MTSDLIRTARELGRARDYRVDANATIEDIAAQVTNVARDYDDEIVAVADIREVAQVAQSYFDGLAESYGLEPGEIVVKV